MFRKWEIALMLSLLLILLACPLLSFADSCTDVCAHTLRLHIRANSDTAADQADKLAVRDALLAQYGSLFSAASSEGEARTLAQNNLDGVTATAREVLRRRGSTHAVRTSVVHMYFATAQYDGFTLPAGWYDALRVDIGAAAGHNWFCVMYPPLCLPAAESADALTAYSANERAVVRSGYTLRFACVEWWQRLHSGA